MDLDATPTIYPHPVSFVSLPLCPVSSYFDQVHPSQIHTTDSFHHHAATMPLSNDYGPPVFRVAHGKFYVSPLPPERNLDVSPVITLFDFSTLHSLITTSSIHFLTSFTSTTRHLQSHYVDVTPESAHPSCHRFIAPIDSRTLVIRPHTTLCPPVTRQSPYHLRVTLNPDSESPTTDSTSHRLRLYHQSSYTNHTRALPTSSFTA